MTETLMHLGFTKTEAQVYLYLTTEGPKKSDQIAKALNISIQYLNQSLKKMQDESIIQVSPKYSNIFSVVPFEKVLDLLIKTNIEEAKRMIKNKKELLSSWRAMTEKNEEKS